MNLYCPSDKLSNDQDTLLVDAEELAATLNSNKVSLNTSIRQYAAGAIRSLVKQIKALSKSNRLDTSSLTEAKRYAWVQNLESGAKLCRARGLETEDETLREIADWIRKSKL